MLVGDNASGDALRLIHTGDGGRHWVTATASAPPRDGETGRMYVGDMVFASARRGWITGSVGGSVPAVYATTDGGGSWTVQRLSPPAGYDLAGAGLTGPLFPGGTADGFLVFRVSLPVPANSPPRSVNFRTFLYPTHDGGRTWLSPVALPATAPSDTVSCVGFLDASHWWLSGWRELWTTGDGGRTWQHFAPTFSGDGRFGCVTFADPVHGYAELVSGPATAALERIGYLESRDGGKTWSPTSLPQ